MNTTGQSLSSGDNSRISSHAFVSHLRNAKTRSPVCASLPVDFNPEPIQSSPQPPPLISYLPSILSFHLCIGLASGVFFQNLRLECISYLFLACCTPHPCNTFGVHIWESTNFTAIYIYDLRTKICLSVCKHYSMLCGVLMFPSPDLWPALL